MSLQAGSVVYGMVVGAALTMAVDSGVIRFDLNRLTVPWSTTQYAVANPLGRTWLSSALFDKTPSPFATIVTQSGQCDMHGHCKTNPLHLSAPRLAD